MNIKWVRNNLRQQLAGKPRQPNVPLRALRENDMLVWVLNIQTLRCTLTPDTHQGLTDAIIELLEPEEPQEDEEDYLYE